MNENGLDRADRKILAILQQNARTSNAEIARRIGMAPSAVLERVRKLERKGVILGYEAKVNHKLLGRELTAFTFVRTEETVGSTESGQLLADLPEVLEVHHTAGQDCYLIKVRVGNTDDLGKMLKQFGRIETVRDTRTTIVLTTVKETLGVRADLEDESPEGGA
jgi:Lrp/AsnC family leucine-responsive transcriptional regulator